MIIREYEYEKEKPWNCQERFIEMVNYDDPWQVYRDKLLGDSSNIFSMIDRMIKDTLREGNKGDNALSFEFEINGGRFVHVSSEWRRPLDEKPIVETVIRR